MEVRVLSFPVMSRIEKRSFWGPRRPTTAPGAQGQTAGSGRTKSQLSNSMALRTSAYNSDNPDNNNQYAPNAEYAYGGQRREHARAQQAELSTHRDDLLPEPPYPQRSSSRYYSTADSSEPHTFPEQAFVTPHGPPMTLPDPSQFPDPYPFRHPHNHLNSMPALSSSGGSASNSTRSSAYASSGSNPTSGDYNNVHIASSDEHVPITPDSISQYLAKDPAAFSAARTPHARPPVDHARWSDAYSSSARSRSSSIGNNSSLPYDNNMVPGVPPLAQKPSYDMSWQSVDERDEVGLMSEDETDDEHAVLDGDSSGLVVDHEEERTSAAVVAEEGRGLIVQANNTAIIQLQVQPGTTHLLIGSSTTPNAIPQFLKNSLPLIATTLLALDISANFLGALPPVLSVCENLEELNVASNPLRVLPVFLADLQNLRLLIADATGISTLPDTLVDLEKLHTLSVRRNKLHSLPSWLCLLPALQTLCVDGNPFQGPWKALVEPLLAKTPMTPAYPPSTPVAMPQLSASMAEHEGEATDNEDGSDFDPSSPSPSALARMQVADEEDHTITPERAPMLGRSVTSQVSNIPPHEQPRPLQRTRTTPNRAYFDQTRPNKVPSPNDPQVPHIQRRDDLNLHPDREVRKMKSAGDLRRGRAATSVANEPPHGLPTLANYSSASSSNLLSSMAPTPQMPPNAKHFGSLGPSSALGVSPRPPGNAARPQLSRSLWDDPNHSSDHSPSGSPEQLRKSYASSSTIQAPIPTSHERPGSSARRPSKESKEKNSRWGFLKKMSMSKMKGDAPSPNSTGPQRHTSGSRPPLPPFNPEELAHTTTPRPMVASNSMPDRTSKGPQIDLRFSSIGALDMPALNNESSPPQQLSKKPSRDMMRGSSLKSSPTPPSHPPVAAASNGLLAPPVPTPRNAKRRSFLPFEAPGTLSIPIPEASAFNPNVTAANGSSATADDDDETTQAPKGLTPSPTTPVVDAEQYIRREEERAREAYMRALRSVMAYLKDMNDLAQSQQPAPISMYGGSAEEHGTVGTRSRRPTMVDREPSMMSNGSGSTDASSQLRSAESILGLRSGTSSQTLSVATTDSSSSMDERKYKDDKGKRAKIIQEIVVTERTYVKGLQELVDIYIKPAATPANLLGGVGSNKDSVVPASERKIVFGGIDALFSFHNDSFLPALERAAAPLFRPKFQETDPDGSQSTDVAKLVGDIFVKHAAFMKMYSSYINNFDNSVQRVKSWTTATAGSASPGHAVSPNASTAQLVSMSLSAVGSPPAMDVGMPTLTTSQKKRIKSYLKRCRLNPRHTQLNLEGYLLLPVQRIPRYKLLLEELVRSTPPTPYEFVEDPLDRALAEISLLTNNMNEGKRESESRRKLVQWQSRIRGKFPSPLVQPHRRLIMDGRLLLTRVVRKAVVSFEAINAQGDASTVQVDCLAPELTPRPLVGILCNDLLVLCRDPSDGKDANSFVDLWAVLRMQTLPQPASIVHGNALRLVDNKAILYFDAPSPSDALNWYRAINLHIPASAKV